MLELPLWPSLVAVIVTEPAACAVTTPDADTVARLASLVDQVITRPARAFPPASFGVATNGTFCPTRRVAAAGVTDTDATGAFTVVTLAVPLIPSLVAVMVAAPGPMAVAAPETEIVTMPALLVVHSTARPVSVSPAASVVIAINCRDPPTVRETLEGLTLTASTGGGATTTVEESAKEPLVARTR